MIALIIVKESYELFKNAYRPLLDSVLPMKRSKELKILSGELAVTIHNTMTSGRENPGHKYSLTYIWQYPRRTLSQKLMIFATRLKMIYAGRSSSSIPIFM
jgi:hypothetical protein